MKPAPDGIRRRVGSIRLRQKRAHLLGHIGKRGIRVFAALTDRSHLVADNLTDLNAVFTGPREPGASKGRPEHARVPIRMLLVEPGEMVLVDGKRIGWHVAGVGYDDALAFRAWPAPFADPARCPDGRPCAGSGRCRSCSLYPSHRAPLRRIGPTRAHAAASRAFRPAHAGLPPQRRCGSGWSRSGSTARGWPPWPRSRVPTAREIVLPPSPGAACAYGRPARR